MTAPTAHAGQRPTALMKRVLARAREACGDGTDGTGAEERAFEIFVARRGAVVRWAPRAVIGDGHGRALLVGRRRGEVMQWVLPGGGREPGETDQQALLRELREELMIHASVQPRPLGMLAFGSVDRPPARVQCGLVYGVSLPAGPLHGGDRLLAWMSPRDLRGARAATGVPAGFMRACLAAPTEATVHDVVAW